MLRRTAAQAFGTTESQSLSTDGGPAAAARAPGTRQAAVDRLFEELVDAIRAEAGRFAPTPAAGSEGDEDSGASMLAIVLTTSGPRAELDGYQFAAEGPGGCIRITNTLQGFLLVRQEADGALRLEELLAAMRQGDAEAYRPIRKPLSPTGCGELRGARKVTFRYTSVPELVREYVRLATGGW